MSLPRYPEYKDSGVDWLKKVPAHWQVEPLKRRYAVVGGSTPKSDVQEYWDGDINWVTPADLSRLSGFEIRDSLRTITEAGLQSCGTSLVPSGSLILSTRAPIGSLGLATMELCTNQGCKALVPRSGELSRFAAYAMSIAGPALNVRGKGTTFLELSGDELASFRLAFPRREEQAAIVTFLDRETARIDVLIAEQEKLLALLAEKRQATISHAVTRGLDPDAPMKDSGIPWLGEVPAHWEVRRLKTLSPAITVGIVVNPSSYVSPSGLPFVYGGDIREGHISVEGCRRIEPEDSDKQPKTRLQAGDLLTVRVGAPGVTAVVPDECEGGNCASVMLIRRGEFDSDWLCFAMNSRSVRFQVEVVQYGAAQEQFNISHAINFWVATPPRDEQRRLANSLNATADRIDELCAEATNAIKLLVERRSALIAAAVTGQIDVRGVVGSKAA